MKHNNKDYNLVIVDDHLLVANSLKSLIGMFSGFNVLYHAKNGLDLQHKIHSESNLPDVILLDVNMPVMNGYETMEWLTKEYPDIKVLALSMDDDEQMVLKMLSRGANGYLLKDIHPETLRVALNEVLDKGYYHSEKVTAALLDSLKPKEGTHTFLLKETELTFLQFACSELTYSEIADKMNVSPKTVDNYRNELFKKFKVKNRVGLVIYGLKKKLIKI
jgi:DNA-binding NarL/FixJ family response regulator